VIGIQCAMYAVACRIYVIRPQAFQEVRRLPGGTCEIWHPTSGISLASWQKPSACSDHLNSLSAPLADGLPPHHPPASRRHCQSMNDSNEYALHSVHHSLVEMRVTHVKASSKGAQHTHAKSSAYAGPRRAQAGMYAFTKFAMAVL